MKVLKKILLFGALLIISGCSGGKVKDLSGGASGDMTEYENGDVNAIEQSKPSIMVIPSDRTLKDFGCLSTRTLDGERYQIRDYRKYLVADEYFKPVVAYIQNTFIDADYPLDDFEQTLKSLDSRNGTDIAEGVAKDSKTRMLSTALPDIVLELDYSITSDFTKSNSTEKDVKYVLNAVDAYTNKVIATIQGDGLSGKDGVAEMSKDMKGRLPKLMGDMQKHFSSILSRGREITVRINVDEESNQKLNDETIEGDSYTDQLMDYMKSHTVKGAYKMQTNTNDQLTFTNVRIKVVNPDGTQYGVYDWTRDLQRYLKKNLGLSSENRSQGLGEVVLTVKGVN